MSVRQLCPSMVMTRLTIALEWYMRAIVDELRPCRDHREPAGASGL